MLRPLQLIWERVERGRQDSDTAFFLDLLYTGEMILRLVTAAFVAAVQDDRERNQYRLCHRLVSVDGLGDWSQALDDALTGPASQHLAPSAREDRRDLIDRLGEGTWQFEAVALLHSALANLIPDLEPLAAKSQLRTWFTLFPVLRNKTRGHGAPTAALCSSVAPDLESSLRLLPKT